MSMMKYFGLIARFFHGISIMMLADSRYSLQIESRKQETKEISDEDPEFRKAVKVNVSNIQKSSVLSRLQEITSSWIKMKGIMALIMVIKGI